MTQQYRVAIAGCHRMLDRTPGNHNFATAFDADAETEIVAVFDLGDETRKAFLECWGAGVAAYDGFGAMLRQERPDILCLATSQKMHADQIEEAVAAGVRGILSDKPLATSLEEADRLLDACRGAGVPLAFGLDRRWLSSYRRLAELVRDGIVGELQSVIVFGIPNLINHGCHWYDAALQLVGDREPEWVSGLVEEVAGEPPDSRRRMDPTGRLMVGLAGGVVLYFTLGGSRRPSFEIVGDQGRLTVVEDGGQAWQWQESGAPQPLDIPQPTGDFPLGMAMVRDLVEAVAGGGRTACDVEEARRATEIGFAAHLSHAQGGARIELPAGDRTLRIPSFPWGNE
ncbi:MAG: Gfo/Idh/MocA family oxidoreductase [Caldilineaceae bacterium]|nr:Gfo/Idh/MocA family oxidoreductase [Caldilineaceae bacterium]